MGKRKAYKDNVYKFNESQEIGSSEELKLYLPHNTELEKAILGAILLDGRIINHTIGVIEPADFFLSNHKEIYRAMVELSESNAPIDGVNLHARLSKNGVLEEIGGIAYVASLIDGAIRTTNIASYVKQLIELSTERELKTAGRLIASPSFEDETTTDAILKARKTIDNIAFRTESKKFTDLASIVSQVIDKIDDVASGRKKAFGISTGFPSLDKVICGLQDQDLILIAGRPGMGKTALALNIARHAAVIEQKKVAFFSLEMAQESLVLRLLCTDAELDWHRVRNGFMTRENWSRLAQAQQELASAQLMIYDDTELNIQTIKSLARRMKAENGLDLIIIDYLQLILPDENKPSREQEVSAISRGLKCIAKELNVPVVALAQLSRAPDMRANDHKPQLSDLRESGSLEQDSDVVIFTYREEWYQPTEENNGIAEIIIAKQRNGPTDEIKLAFIKHLTKFAELWRD